MKAMLYWLSPVIPKTSGSHPGTAARRNQFSPLSDRPTENHTRVKPGNDDRLAAFYLTVADLHTLLKNLSNSQRSPGIRLKLRGLPWPAYHSRVLVYTDRAIVLAHMPTRTVSHIMDLRDVDAMEMNGPFEGLYSFLPYSIIPNHPTNNTG